MRVDVVFLVVFVLVVPMASAFAPFEASLRLNAPNVGLDGTLGIEIQDGALGTVATMTAVITLRHVNGSASLVRTNATFVQVLSQHAKEPTDPPEAIDIPLRDAEIVLTLVREPWTMFATTAPGGRIVGTAGVAEEGRPAVLARDTGSVLLDASPVLGGTPPPRVDWRQGWPFVGNWTPPGDTRLPSFPRWEDASASMSGPLRLTVWGGNVTIVDARGTRSFRLGSWVEQDVARVPTGDASIDHRVTALLSIDGNVGSTTVPLRGQWGLAGATTTWDLGGRVSWQDASGSVTRDGMTRRFDHADVSGDGVVSIFPMGRAGITGDRDQVEVGGRWTSLTIDGGAVGSSSALPTAAAVVGIGALVLALAGFALFTRIAPARLLDHDRRAGIHAIVHARPGIHLRELHRLVGGAWGPFTFHLGMLRQGGFVRFEKHGRYTAVLPSGRSAGARAVHHPVAKSILAALDRAPHGATAAQLQESAGISRQLLRYHLGVLARAGQVSIEGRGTERVVRALQPPT